VILQDPNPPAPSITFRRVELNGTPWVLKLDLTPNTRIEWPQMDLGAAGRLKTPLHLATTDGQPLQFTVEGKVPFPPLTPLRPEELLNQQASMLLLSGSDRYQNAVRDLRMLAYREKLLAGTWHFETYFGRDTLLSLSMLSNTLTPQALRDGVDSVLTRLSPEGVVAHEESIGAWAEVEDLSQIDNGGPIADPWEAPWYDYKMVDSDYLLPLTEAELPPAEFRKLMQGPRQEAVLRNWNRILVQASNDLVRINPGFTVGDWRDSSGGLAGGVYPGDVNTILLPGALQVIRQGLTRYPGLVSTIVARHPYAALAAATQPAWFDRVQAHWSSVPRRFEVRLSPAQVRERVSAYLLAMPKEVGDALAAQPILGGPTIKDFLQGANVPGWDGHLRFWALSADRDEHPIPVLNSDMCFRLFYQHPHPPDLDDMVLSCRLPFPLGLMLPVGMVVADPAYSANPQLWKSLDWDAYHGVVVWGWQHNMLALGLRRQLARTDISPALRHAMSALLVELQQAEANDGALTNSELWTWQVQNGRIEPLAFGVRSTSSDEADALQLWSAAWAGVYLSEHSH
jgi:hypothetical protein